MSIRLSEAPLAQLVHGLSTDLFDASLAMINDVDAGILRHRCGRTRWWSLFLRDIRYWSLQGSALEEVVSYPLVLCDPHGFAMVAADSVNCCSDQSRPDR